ncbi:plasmid pRiA4b ORF-3 family protein [Schleiferilactobacillus harbinensis]|uniref:plasmid pRiA4b ORF-3 family protein n=1 Tax=Schleiferilactobacillus harbinensis TaxID=304207 RepID=UPI00345E0FA0
MPRKKKQYLQLKIQLQHEKPVVWRRVIVPDTMHLDQLHVVIQVVLAWDNAHIDQFWNTQSRDFLYVPYIDDDLPADQALTSKTTVWSALESGNLIYDFDFESELDQRIHLEKIVDTDALAGQPAPRCIAGRGTNPYGDQEFDLNQVNNGLKAAFPTEDTVAKDCDLTEGNGYW